VLPLTPPAPRLPQLLESRVARLEESLASANQAIAVLRDKVDKAVPASPVASWRQESSARALMRSMTEAPLAFHDTVMGGGGGGGGGGEGKAPTPCRSEDRSKETAKDKGHCASKDQVARIIRDRVSRNELAYLMAAREEDVPSPTHPRPATGIADSEDAAHDPESTAVADAHRYHPGTTTTTTIRVPTAAELGPRKQDPDGEEEEGEEADDEEEHQRPAKRTEMASMPVSLSLGGAGGVGAKPKPIGVGRPLFRAEDKVAVVPSCGPTLFLGHAGGPPRPDMRAQARTRLDLLGTWLPPASTGFVPN
jgi:hypothetical protein